MAGLKVLLTSDIDVEEVLQCGGDLTVVHAARVSTRGKMSYGAKEGKDTEALLRSLIRNKPAHSVPFEHSLLTVRAHVPAFVWWEWTRHRFQAIDVPGLSFSLESGRYRQLEPVFWVPPRDRPSMPVDGFKPMRPEFRVPNDREYEVLVASMSAGYQAMWATYKTVTGCEFANEVARAVLGFGVYYAGWASGSLLAWLHFLTRRTRVPGTEAAGYPQAEIETAAKKVEEIVAARWPVCHRLWNENGRVTS